MGYEFSSVQVNLPLSLRRKIVSWGNENISEPELCNHHNLGREDRSHVTVLYGIHSADPAEAIEVLANIEPFEVKLGKISLFTTNDDFDVVKIDVKSNKLHELNRKLRDKCTYTNKFRVYRPHVTIAYVKKGAGWRHDGDDEFDGESFDVKRAFFSSKNGKVTPIDFS